MNEIVTFYSYKGGVGRTMALANVAVLLTQWNYRVLLVDWDLEAPGLENFFQNYLSVKEVSQQPGLIELLETSIQTKSTTPPSGFWKSYCIPIHIPNSETPLHLITAGTRDDNYFRRVRQFDFSTFYSQQHGGEVIEQLRNEWKSTYDLVLIDSRTGVTDIGGVCTIQLPDMLVMLFTATQHGFEGILDVITRASTGRQPRPYDRYGLNFLPMPSRFDTQNEFKLSNEWLDRFAAALEDVYDDWLPDGISKRDLLDLTKLPYVSYFSFGETLPVIEQGVRDPTGLGHAYETLAALIANGLEDADVLLENRDHYIAIAQERMEPIMRSVKKDEWAKNVKMERPKVNVFLMHASEDDVMVSELMNALRPLNRHYSLHILNHEANIGEAESRDIRATIERGQLILLLFSRDFLASDFLQEDILAVMLDQHYKGETVILPVLLRPALWEGMLPEDIRPLPSNREPMSKWEDQDEAFLDVVQGIKAALDQHFMPEPSKRFMKKRKF